MYTFTYLVLAFSKERHGSNSRIILYSDCGYSPQNHIFNLFSGGFNPTDQTREMGRVEKSLYISVIKPEPFKDVPKTLVGVAI